MKVKVKPSPCNPGRVEPAEEVSSLQLAFGAVCAALEHGYKLEATNYAYELFHENEGRKVKLLVRIDIEEA